MIKILLIIDAEGAMCKSWMTLMKEITLNHNNLNACIDKYNIDTYTINSNIVKWIFNCNDVVSIFHLKKNDIFSQT